MTDALTIINKSPELAALLATIATPENRAFMARLKAARRGYVCFRCEHVFAADEAVYRVRCTIDGAGHQLHPVCERCSTWPTIESGPCAHCGRIVHHSDLRLDRRRTYCCEACAWQHRTALIAARARQKRADARGPSRPCRTCGEHFEARRADAAYCSVACQQRAYRRRRSERDSVCGVPNTANAKANAADLAIPADLSIPPFLRRHLHQQKGGQKSAAA
jgi:hypothetical protein